MSTSNYTWCSKKGGHLFDCSQI